MQRRLVPILLLALAVAAVATYAQRARPTAPMPRPAPNMMQFSAALSGASEVPPVRTTARGQAIFTPTPTGSSVNYRLMVSNIKDVTEAHIHVGKPGTNGQHVVVLMTPRQGAVAQGVITDKDLMGPLKGKRIADLAKAMMNGDTYVNVHTKAHPDGEIRGQIAPKK